jgi:hypothetical protein
MELARMPDMHVDGPSSEFHLEVEQLDASPTHGDFTVRITAWEVLPNGTPHREVSLRIRPKAAAEFLARARKWERHIEFMFKGPSYSWPNQDERLAPWQPMPELGVDQFTVANDSFHQIYCIVVRRMDLPSVITHVSKKHVVRVPQGNVCTDFLLLPWTQHVCPVDTNKIDDLVLLCGSAIEQAGGTDVYLHLASSDGGKGSSRDLLCCLVPMAEQWVGERRGFIVDNQPKRSKLILMLRTPSNVDEPIELPAAAHE